MKKKEAEKPINPTILERHWQTIVSRLQKRVGKRNKFLPLLKQEARNLQQSLLNQVEDYVNRMGEQERDDISGLSYEELNVRYNYFCQHSSSAVWQIITNVRCVLYQKGDQLSSEEIEAFRHPAPYRYVLRWKVAITKILRVVQGKCRLGKTAS